MRWVTAQKLEEWARTIGSRFNLGALLSDLCRASAPDLAAVRFPSGDKGQVRGFDGRLISQVSALNVPDGESVWEFGVDADYRQKLLSDFRSRTDDVDASIQAVTTLVLVTPWTWDSSRRDGKIEDWIKSRVVECNWKRIEVLDGAALESWLDACPAVAAWHARNTLKSAPPQGVRSTDEFWADFSGRFNPPLSEEVLLCERVDPQRRVLEFLSGPSGQLPLLADSQDEAVAFAVAVIRRASPEQRLFLEARTLVVDELSAGRPLALLNNLTLLVRNDAARSPGQLAQRAPVLVPLGRQQRGRSALALGRPNGFEFGQALQTMQIAENEAMTLARGCGRSLAALERLRPGGSSEDPRWMEDADDLLPLLLAGGWDAANTLDTAVAAEIAGRHSYAGLERAPRRHLTHDDPPLDLEGSIWKVRAPMDAFVRAGHRIDSEIAGRLKAAMVKVFGHVDLNDGDPSLTSFAREERPHYSVWLREGLATTLLLLAVWGKLAGVNLGGQSGQAFADATFRDIPNLASDHRLWESLRAELPLLAEAAPRPFLFALEACLECEAITPLLEEKEGLLFPVSRLPPLLWALETTAWDPEHFRPAVELLARLAEVARPGRSGNTAVNSLREIFLLWNPNTNALLDQRLGALDEMTIRHPAVAWDLLVALLPRLHGFSTSTAKPRLREGGAADRPPMPMSEYQRGQAEVVARAIAAAGDDPARWTVLARALGDFAPAERREALAQLDDLLSRLLPNAAELWKALRDEVAKHERFPSAQWALPGAELAPWRALVLKYAPADRVDQAAFQFDTASFEDYRDEAAAEAKRVGIVRELLASDGLEAVVRLGSLSRLPFLVVRAFAALNPEADQVRRALVTSVTADPTSSVAVSFSGLFRTQVGLDPAAEILTNLLAQGTIDATGAVALLAAWPDTPDTWMTSRRLGAGVEDAYWARHGLYYDKDAPKRTFLRALVHLRRAGHAVAAVESASQRLADVPSRLLLALLQEVVSELNADTARIDTTMLSHHAELVLNALDAREDVTDAEIASRELAIQPLLRHSSRPLKLHRVLASEPLLFCSLLEALYRRVDAPATEPDDEARAWATRAYQMLADFQQLPGMAGDRVDGAVLRQWVDAVRSWAAENGRAEVADSAIGKLLAHAPSDPDGGWPLRAIRDEIERLASDAVETGLKVERFNMRGVYSRALYAGGDDERHFATGYRNDAELSARWPRTAFLLRDIAQDWERHAEAEDRRAAQMRLRS